MCKIYIDFDGVLVDTPKYIKKEIAENGNCESTFVNIEWRHLLTKCSPIRDNIEFIKKIYKYNDIAIITHSYSQNEKNEKIKYIKEKIGDIEVLVVPYNIKKSEYVAAKDNLLIDDYNYNISCWIDDGGIGLLFKIEMSLEDMLTNYLNESI